ncbi:hypothetical protein RSOLAG22IIIB_08641 [Rhizoctonia solani]|uniref:TM7S3/TM198-like domain-containing protein n=1 Tax=Rhizoctonia solani TaxID=456999 RepID=A0A0K6FUI7_9AGAM|nr:hypothetical protein RSOLAG22IIIB_08641 [Rhizoctonia solani]
MMRTSNFITVDTILHSPYYFVYALPLLLLSILLLFAGTFLTLDRTRSSASSSDDHKAAKFYRLESGVGGLAIGWVLGVHMTTLIAFVILNEVETTHLSAPAFLVIWLLSAIIFTVVCGRWIYATLAFGGILGGACIGLILAISLYPSLIARLVLTLIAMVMLTGGALLPTVRRASLRIATSATGAVGIIYACTILGSSAKNNKYASWTNAWLHLVLLHDSDSAELQWGAGESKGLTAACYFLWMIGAACDWYLKQRVGAGLDETRNNDSYSAASSLEGPQSGMFASLGSRWTSLKERIRTSNIDTRAKKPLLFLSDAPSQSTPTIPKFHQSPKAPPVFRSRMPGAFASDPYCSDSDSDLGDGESPSRVIPNEMKCTESTNYSDTTYSDTTLVNPEGVRRQHKVGRAFQPSPIFTSSPSSSHIEYGDKDAERSPELNLGPHRIEPSNDSDENWKPVFLKRSDSLKADIVEAESRDVTTMAPPAMYSPDNHGPASIRIGSETALPTSAFPDNSFSTPGFVLRTPSLVRALDRVSRAQRQAHAKGNPPSNSTREVVSRNPIDAHQGDDNGASVPRENDRWWGFWNGVQQKAAEP